MTDTPTPDLCVIIVNWNVRDLLEACLTSVYRLTQGIRFEVCVVDNNSSDGSADMVRREFPQVRLITNRENAGFARANNEGLKARPGRYALFLNPDCELIDNAPGEMVAFMDAHREAAGLGCKLIFPEGTPQDSCRHFPSLFTDLMENIYLDACFPRSAFFNRIKMGQWGHDRLRPVDVAYGACLLVRGSVLEVVGSFDERFYLYYDEIDLCYRIKKAGGAIYFNPAIAVIHRANQSSRQIQIPSDRWKIRSKLLFFEKRYGRRGVTALVFNLLMNGLVVWAVLNLIHSIAGRPRDMRYFKDYFRFRWHEYMRFLKGPPGEVSGP